MHRLLTDAGIIVLENHAVKDLGPFRLAAATDLDNRQEPLRDLLTAADVAWFEALPSDKPRFAFLHWGQEYTGTPGPREQALAARLGSGGVELVIGSHPHRAGVLTGDRQQCLAYSLGNFIFDQRRPEVSGALLEVMFYPQGTYFLRLHPLGNLYEENFSARQDAAPINRPPHGAIRLGPGNQALSPISNLTGGYDHP